MGSLRNILNINHLAYKYSILLLVTYFYYLIILIYLEYVHIRVHICATVHVCRSEENFRESVISFHHTCLRAQTQVHQTRQHLLPTEPSRLCQICS